MSLTNQGAYHFGEFQLNLDLRVLARKGERVPLGSKAYGVLTCLVTHAGEVVTKADLLTTVWTEAFVEEGALSQQIFSLRKALGDKADYIVTVPGQGYRFMGAVRHVFPNASIHPVPRWEEALQETHERTHVVIEEPMLPTAARVSVRARQYSVAATGLIAIGLLSGWMMSRRVAARQYQSVVLTDFSNATGDGTFDRTLKRALEIDLEQSPYMDVLSERDEAATLQMMGRTGDSAITANVAREVCERSNRQVLLTGSISSVGDEYLLTLEASDCNTGKKLASTKTEAVNKTKVLGALDSLADRMRSKLGESAKSVRGYDVPFQDAATTSLDALKAYSIGKYMQAKGSPDADSLQLFQRAVALDPRFAQAYGEIGVSYYNLSEPQLASENLKKAFDLRDRLGAREKLAIEAHYYVLGQGDVLAGIKAFQLWADTYPRDWTPWLNMANWYTQLGQYGPSIVAGQRALELEQSPVCYIVLGRAYKDANRFADVKALGEVAVRGGKDTAALHALLFQVAFLEHDTSTLAREDQWLALHKDSLHAYFAAKAAAQEGRLARAEDLFHEEIAAEKRKGLAEEADDIAIEEATTERDAGLLAVARATLSHVGKIAKASPEFAVERAMLRDLSFAQQFLTVHSNDAHPTTYMFYVQLPRLRAALAMGRGKPLDAVAALEAPTPYGLNEISMNSQRAVAHLQAGQTDLAANDYKQILANPGSPFFIEYPLAHLGLARAYVKAGDRNGARAEYANFLAAWKDADPGLPVLQAAKAEFAAIR